MKKAITVIQLLVLVVFLGVMSSIVLTETKKLETLGFNTIKRLDSAVVQRSVNEYFIKEKSFPSLNGVPSMGNPKKIDFVSLSKYLSSDLFTNSEFEYWITHNGKVYQTLTTAPTNIEVDIDGISWDLVPNAIGYNIGIFVDNVSNLNFNDVYAAEKSIITKNEKTLNEDILKVWQVKIDETRGGWEYPEEMKALIDLDKVFVVAIDRKGLSSPPVTRNFDKEGDYTYINQDAYPPTNADTTNTNTNPDNTNTNTSNTNTNPDDTTVDNTNTNNTNNEEGQIVSIYNDSVSLNLDNLTSIEDIVDYVEIRNPNKWELSEEGIVGKGEFFIPLSNPITDESSPYFEDNLYSNYKIEYEFKLTEKPNVFTEYLFYFDTTFKRRVSKNYGWAIRRKPLRNRTSLVKVKKGRVIYSSSKNLNYSFKSNEWDEFHKVTISVEKIDDEKKIDLYVDGDVVLINYDISDMLPKSEEVYIGLELKGNKSIVIKSVKFEPVY